MIGPKLGDNQIKRLLLASLVIIMALMLRTWPIGVDGGFKEAHTENGDYSEQDFSLKSSTYNTVVEWSWLAGNDSINVNGVYGSKGVPSSANNPGSRDCSVSWTDADGNLWVFGGYGYAASGGLGVLNDLWRYNITSGVWTWMEGSNTVNVNGVYGSKGVPSSGNYPGSRICPESWTDEDGNLWLFGGEGYPASGGAGWLNDLWRYNINSGVWTWMEGSNTVDLYGVYGTKGVPSSANNPGSRYCSVTWTDLDGNLWLFGGFGYAASGSIGELNDLWRYNISSGLWTWMSGNNTININGVYGTKGVPSSENYPGSRDDSVSWIDADGNLWLFGGIYFYIPFVFEMLNDLWRYNITSGVWTWMSGHNTPDVNGVYGTKGVPSSGNYPGSRYGGTSWKDLDGNLWLFGGDGFSASGGNEYLNDLWRYNITSGIWTWMSGNSTGTVNGVYGTKGIPSSDNYPGSRLYSLASMDPEGNFYLFGGSGHPESGGSGYLNDLWKASIPLVDLHILIKTPKENQLIGSSPPNFELTIIGPNLSATWYSLDGGITNYTFTGATGTINATAWEGLEDECTVTLRFYANNSLGKVFWSDVTVRKDILAPRIGINMPTENQVVDSTPPNFDVNVSDANLNTKWYTLDGGTTNYTFAGSTGTINVMAWQGLEDECTVTIRFYANDSLGNLAWSNVTVRKDILAPRIGINMPTENQVDDSTPPNFDVNVSDANLNTTWYSLIGDTTNYLFTGSTGTINAMAWAGLEDECTVTIRFYANDSLGNLGWSEVTVRKDILAPRIEINTPTFYQLRSTDSPNFDVSITDANLNATWYTLNGGTTNYLFTGSTGMINALAWTAAESGYVFIRFYANDTRGNIDLAHVIVIKEFYQNPQDESPPEYLLDYILFQFILIGLLSLIGIVRVIIFIKKNSSRSI